jgi:threonine dehydrogenase-like Zn-dependent dehydrogenase
LQALQFSDSIPRYALGKVAGRGFHGIYWSGFGNLRYVDVPRGRLPTEEWARVDTRYGGICGSDIGLVLLHSSTSTSPFTSFPFVVGHENVGRISQIGRAVKGFSIGQRVVVDPVLGCAVRGFKVPCEHCASGNPNLCLRFREGTIAPGMLTGFCRDTGGSWSPSFVAHQSQLVAVPDSVSDEAALLAEPFAVALHAVLRNAPKDGQTVLIIGAGVIGLCTLAALRATGSRARIIITARHSFQIEMAKRLGADEVVRPGRGAELYRQIAGLTNASVHKPIIGKEIVSGGADVVYECVGGNGTVDDALRLTNARGTMVLVGLAGVPRGVDWTPIWLNEVSVRGSFCYAIEEHEGQRISTTALAIKLMEQGKVDLARLFTHRFALADYREALATVTSKGKSGVIKAAFAFDEVA